MLNVFVADPRGCLTKIEVASDGSLPIDAVWLDLLAPTLEEERQVEAMLGVGVPTREEMQEIEVSSRLYEENGALYMTTTVVARADTERPEASAISFILAGDRLATVRYAEPQSFTLFAARCQRSPGFTRGDAVLAGLLDALIDRIADVIEHLGLEVDGLSHEVFEHPATPRKTGDFQRILRSLGRRGDLISKVRESLVGIGRLVMFFGQAGTANAKPKDRRARLRTMTRDVRSLTEHASFLSGKINFLLDATLGMINIEQNAIIKIFSVVAVVFLPPTLIASIYGMNFTFMPELAWPLGYPVAIALMLGSALAPLLYFRRRGWL
ncbi:MAG: magnesium transporter CorA family protein [Geminicoccaceae bacterium]